MVENDDFTTGKNKRTDRNISDSNLSEYDERTLAGKDHDNVPSGDVDNDLSNDTPTMGSSPSISFDLDASPEMNAGPGSGLTAASTRFGDEFTASDNAILSGKTGDAWIEDEASRASARFGEELGTGEKKFYTTDPSDRATTDDLTDDNDALTDRSATNSKRDSEPANDDKNLWEKIKDKAEDIGEGIKKAFD